MQNQLPLVPTPEEIAQQVQRNLKAEDKKHERESSFEQSLDEPWWQILGKLGVLGVILLFLRAKQEEVGWVVIVMYLAPILLPLSYYLYRRKQKQRYRKVWNKLAGRVETIGLFLERHPEFQEGLRTDKHRRYMLLIADSSRDLSDEVLHSDFSAILEGERRRLSGEIKPYNPMDDLVIGRSVDSDTFLKELAEREEPKPADS